MRGFVSDFESNSDQMSWDINPGKFVKTEMLKGLNAKVENVLEKFHPLEGAYSHSKHNH